VLGMHPWSESEMAKPRLSLSSTYTSLHELPIGASKEA
jgi:hypothetical protein